MKELILKIIKSMNFISVMIENVIDYQDSNTDSDIIVVINTIDKSVSKYNDVDATNIIFGDLKHFFKDTDDMATALDRVNSSFYDVLNVLLETNLNPECNDDDFDKYYSLDYLKKKAEEL